MPLEIYLGVVLFPVPVIIGDHSHPGKDVYFLLVSQGTLLYCNKMLDVCATCTVTENRNTKKLGVLFLQKNRKKSIEQKEMPIINHPSTER